MHRRKLLRNSALLAAGQASAFAYWKNGQQKRVALVGTGIRGSSLWGKNLVDNYGDEVEDAADPLSHMAGTRDGALSILIGITARKSIAEGRAVRLDELVKV